MMMGDPMMGFMPPEALMGMMGQQPGMQAQPASLAQMIAGQPMWQRPTDSTMAAMGAPTGAQPGMPPMQAMGQAMQAVQRPAPVQPLMHGGVTGAQKAPDMQVHAGQTGAELQALLALLTGRGQAPAVPTLGSLIR